MKNPRPLSERFWPKVQLTDTCWLWNGSLHKTGYGKLKVRGKDIPAHRLSWTFQHGEPPGGLFVCHHCDIRQCVNPSHLFLGTCKDNMRDAARKGRLAFGERVGGRRKLTSNDVLTIREEYLTRSVTQRSIAKRFNVTRQQIGYIVTGKTWKWLL